MSELDNHSQNSDKFNDSFSYKENKSYLKISFERIAFIFFIFFILAIIFSSKVILLSIKKIPEIQKTVKKDNFRSSILDNEGNILAKSVPIVNIGINNPSVCISTSLIKLVATNVSCAFLYVLQVPYMHQ